MAENLQADQVLKIVNETLITEFELEPQAIVDSARLREELGLDSLDAVDLVVALEKALKVQISEEVAKKMRTVGDIYRYVRENVQ
jgi:acyl carrier protein